MNTQAVLLTYQGIDACLSVALACWTRFLDFVKGNLRNWGVKYWTATLETNKNGKHHLHLMLDFRKKIDRVARFFEFEGFFKESVYLITSETVQFLREFRYTDFDC